MPAVYAPTNSQVPEISQTTSFAAGAGLFYAIAGSANVTATLPTAVGIAGTVVRIRCTSGYTGLCTIATVSGQLLGPAGATTQIIYTGESALVQSDGVNWIRTGGVIIPCVCKMIVTLATTSVPTNTATQALLTFVFFDNSGHMGNIAGHTISIFRPGLYRLCGAATWAAASTSDYNFYTSIRNGANQLTFTQTAFGANTFTNFSQVSPVSTTTVPLLAGDALSLFVFQQANGGGNLQLIGSFEGDATFLEAQEIPSW